MSLPVCIADPTWCRSQADPARLNLRNMHVFNPHGSMNSTEWRIAGDTKSQLRKVNGWHVSCRKRRSGLDVSILSLKDFSLEVLIHTATKSSSFSPLRAQFCAPSYALPPQEFIWRWYSARRRRTCSQVNHGVPHDEVGRRRETSWNVDDTVLGACRVK